MMKINNNSRREFLINLTKSLGVCSCAAIAGSILSSCENFTELTASSQGITKVIDITSPTDIPKELHRNLLQSIGGGGKAVFDDANYSIPVILVRVSETEIACFSSLCTHDNCYGDDLSVPISMDRPLISCGCHGSTFDPHENGKAVVGPAEKPLKQFKTSFVKETNILTIEF